MGDTHGLGRRLPWVVSLLLAMGFPTAAGASWQQVLAPAFAKAKRENRPILLVLSLPGCPSCEQLSRGLDDIEDMRRLTRDFLVAEVNAGIHAQVASALGVSGFPTSVVLNPGGSEIGRFCGFSAARDYVRRGRSLLRKWHSSTRQGGETRRAKVIRVRQPRRGARRRSR